jgi:hypothetical protein
LLGPICPTVVRQRRRREPLRRGTPAGACVIDAVSGVHMPPFFGKPGTVIDKFNIAEHWPRRSGSAGGNPAPGGTSCCATSRSAGTRA